MKPSDNIDEYIADLNDWRGELLAHLRSIILEADPDVIEEWKWKGVPVWSDGGVIAFANGLKDRVKLGFLNGANLNDPDGLFNAELEGRQRRAIEFKENDKINKNALIRLVQAGAAYNKSKGNKNRS